MLCCKAPILIEFYFRYKRVSYARVNNAGDWRSNQQLLKDSSYVLTGGVMYALTVISINSIFNLRAFNIYSICLEREEAKNNNPILTLIFIMLPLITLISVTCTMDFTCLIWLTNRRLAINPNNDNINVGCINVIDEIPLRATMINTLILIPYIITSVVISQANVTPIEKYLIALLSMRFNDIVRSPLIVTCTFKVNNDNRAINREIRRQKEIQAALKRRWERRLENSSTVWIEMEDIKLSVDQIQPEVPNQQDLDLPNQIASPEHKVQELNSSRYHAQVLPERTSINENMRNPTVFIVQVHEIPKDVC